MKFEFTPTLERQPVEKREGGSSQGETPSQKSEGSDECFFVESTDVNDLERINALKNVLIQQHVDPVKEKLKEIRFNPFKAKERAALKDQLQKAHETVKQELQTGSIAQTLEKINRSFPGIPLDKETGKLLLKTATSNPERFKIVSDFLENPHADLTVTTAALRSSMKPQEDVNEFNKLTSFLMEIDSTRSIQNTQFNMNQFEEAIRRNAEIQDYQTHLTDPTHQSKLYSNDTDVIQQQKENIGKAQAWARLNGYGETTWWPGGLSGNGILYSADWDPQTLTDGGPLEVSRHIGMMLGDRLRMTRVTTTIPGDFTAHQKEEMLAKFNSLTADEAKKFREKYKTQIQRMHEKLTGTGFPNKAELTPENQPVKAEIIEISRKPRSSVLSTQKDSLQAYTSKEIKALLKNKTINPIEFKKSKQYLQDIKAGKRPTTTPTPTIFSLEDVKNILGDQALYWAIENDHTNIAIKLVSQNPKLLDLKNESKETPMFLAIQKNNAVLAKEFANIDSERRSKSLVTTQRV